MGAEPGPQTSGELQSHAHGSGQGHISLELTLHLVRTSQGALRPVTGRVFAASRVISTRSSPMTTLADARSSRSRVRIAGSSRKAAEPGHDDVTRGTCSRRPSTPWYRRHTRLRARARRCRRDARPRRGRRALHRGGERRRAGACGSENLSSRASQTAALETGRSAATESPAFLLLSAAA
jgi:hypothetical protein